MDKVLSNPLFYTARVTITSYHHPHNSVEFSSLYCLELYVPLVLYTLLGSGKGIEKTGQGQNEIPNADNVYTIGK